MDRRLQAGTKLGRYEVRSKLGEGGMGELYLADDSQLGLISNFRWPSA